jgi:hypothetical protein
MDRFLPVISWYGRMRFAAVYAKAQPGFPNRKLCQFTVRRRAWQFGAVAGRAAGKRALVTAAAHGIGRATALALPPSSVLATDIAEDKLAPLADALLLHRTRNRKFESISLQRRVERTSNTSAA